MRQLIYQVCYTRYHVLFYLWLIGSALKHCKVPKYYDPDCSSLSAVVKGSYTKTWKSLYIFYPKLNLFFRIPPDDRFLHIYRLIPSWLFHKLVNCLVLRERINAKPIVTILFFNIFDKPVHFEAEIRSNSEADLRLLQHPRWSASW